MAIFLKFESLQIDVLCAASTVVVAAGIVTKISHQHSKSHLIVIIDIQLSFTFQRC